MTTVVGIWPNPASPPTDLRAAADLAFLRSTTSPAVGDGESIRVADLFSGCGAMSVGIAEACRALGLRFEAAAALEIDALAIGVYAKNFGLRGARAKPRDLGAELAKYALRRKCTRGERAMRRRIGRVDLAVAGPPCQGHSDLNNSTRRADPRNELYLRVARFAKVFTPRWIIVENVTAVRHDKGNVVQRTTDALVQLGYEVVEGVVSLQEIGVPQTRRRHVLLAVRRKGRGHVEKPLEAVDAMIAKYRTDRRTVEWAIKDLDGGMGPWTAFDTSSRATARTQERIDWLFDHDAHNLPDSERPDCHRTKEHSYKSVYGRMWWDRPAPTITGGFETMGRGRFVHPGCRRTITPHEAARLQMIPDFFDFSPALQAHSRLAVIIGNAVPPKLSYVLALELLR
ncbi:MAG: DNA cytosine methyltransferase [Gemmatimonadaceae bacterium]